MFKQLRGVFENITAKFKIAALGIAVVSLAFVMVLSIPAGASADVSCSPDSLWLAGSSWLSGSGVNVCSPDEGNTNVCVPVTGAPAGTCSAGSALSGTEWQCVELVNRLYLTNGWISSHWYGNGDTLINNLPSNLTDQLNGAISYINPGDAITLTYGTGPGHAAIINSVSGTTYGIINQNVPGGVNSSAYIKSGTSLSAGNATLEMNAWDGYSVQAIVHAPLNEYDIAFQGSTGDLYDYYSSSGQTADPPLGMASGTSPSMAAPTSSNDFIAFQGSSGDLYVYDAASGQTADPPLGMASNTSPSNTMLSTGAYEVAFQGSNGYLNVYNSSSAQDTQINLTMKSGTSPTIIPQANGNYYVAFQGSSGYLDIYNSNGGGTTQVGLGMMAGTSPSITTLSSGYLEAVIQANNGYLYDWTNYNGGEAAEIGLGMASGTSPDITTITSGAFEVAIQGSGGGLYIYDSSSQQTTHPPLGLLADTSPSIYPFSSGGYEVAFQGSNDYLNEYNSTTTNGTQISLTLKSSTSPSIGN